MTAETLTAISQKIMKTAGATLATHLNPDGDAIGSVLALAAYLRSAGKDIVITYGSDGPIPDQYAFLPGSDGFTRPADIPSDQELFIALDCSSRDRLGDCEKSIDTAESTINIDHHRGNTLFADMNFVDEKSASCAELVFRLVKELERHTGKTIDHDMAVCLYTGIVTDTGRFQYSSTCSNTMRAAAELLEYGVDPGYVFHNVFENLSLERVRLWGSAFLKARLEPGDGIISAFVSADDLKASGAKQSDIEDLIDTLRAVRSVEVAVLMKETENGLKVSLRSTGKTDVGLLAREFGGGGHAMAAGFSTALDEVSVIGAITSRLPLYQRGKE